MKASEKLYDEQDEQEGTTVSFEQDACQANEIQAAGPGIAADKAGTTEMVINPCKAKTAPKKDKKRSTNLKKVKEGQKRRAKPLESRKVHVLQFNVCVQF